MNVSSSECFADFVNGLVHIKQHLRVNKEPTQSTVVDRDSLHRA